MNSRKRQSRSVDQTSRITLINPCNFIIFTWTCLKYFSALTHFYLTLVVLIYLEFSDCDDQN